MPSRRSLRQIVGISPHAELIVMVSLGLVRNTMDWFSFTWNGNVQEIWNLPGPEPSFTAKYHFDYWIKNVLSLVVLFRNFTTHLHLVFYIVMLYPLLTGEQPRLILPWLYLQMLKNIVTDVICTVAGVILCWILHSCGLLTLEFLVVRIISMMPSIYLWRRIRSYYFDLYYAELDAEFAFPVTKVIQGLTLAQRRRATKSLDGTISVLTNSDDRARINSCLTYEEFFGPANWEADSDNKLSKSLTTLLTIESQESDDVEEDSCLTIIEDENLTPAEKTMKILGLTREEVDATILQLHKRTSTTDLGESGTGCRPETSIDADVRSSFFSVTGETVQSRAIGIQVRFTNEPKANDAKCECCEETKCSKDEDTDSDDEEETLLTETTQNSEDRLSRGKPLDCCDRDREEKGKCHEIEMDSEEKDYVLSGNDSKGVPSVSTYYKNDSNPGSCLMAIVERDGIAWENLKEINFVSVINKTLWNEIKPFQLEKDSEIPEKIVSPNFQHPYKDSSEESRCQSDQNIKEIIPEREDGTRFIHRTQESLNLDSVKFCCPTSASFGIDSDILAHNTSYIFENNTISGTQSFDSTTTPTKELIRPNHDTEFDSYFESSFQRHSNMFDDTRVQLEPLSRRVHSSDYRVVHNRANEDSRFCQTDVNSFEEKIDGNFYSPGSYRSRSNTPLYQQDYYDAWDFNQGNLKGNEIDVVQDIPESNKSNDLKDQQIITGTEIQCSSLQIADKVLSSSPTSLTKENNESIHVSQTSYLIFRKSFEGNKSNSNLKATVQTEEQDKSTTPFVAMNETITGEKSSCSQNSRFKNSKDRRSLVSSSRISKSSKTDETLEERETKEMEALRAYNEKTLFKYKREMDACKVHENVQDEFRDIVGKKSPVGNYGSNFNQAFYVPSVPELEKPEKELILNIEKAYARFTRSKPVDPVNSGALRGNCVAKEFLDIYTSDGRLKKDSRKIKVNDKTGMRKRHSKYSKLIEVTNESDVISRSCKLIEGSQKGRELDRIIAKENIRSQNVEVYFLERQIDDKPTTSKNVPLTTIKSFSRKDGSDPFPTVSSEILTSDGTRSPMVEDFINPEETHGRIQDSNYQRQLRNKNLPKNVKEVVENIDWSFQRPTFIESDSNCEDQARNMHTEIMRVDLSLERQNIVHKTTENILQSVFSNSENSERGFRLGESENEVYPIFHTVVTAMEEIVKAAALRGYNDEFISQPATEIEIPEIDSGNLYGSTNLPSELRWRSSSGFLRCCVLPEDTRVVKNRGKNEESLSMTTFIAPDLEEKKLEAVRREKNSLDQDETIFIEDEKASALLSKLISFVEPRSAEINIPVLGQEDLPVEPKDTSGDLPNSQIRDLENYLGYQNPEESIQIGPKTNKISSEEVRLALHNVILQFPSQEIPNSDRSKLKFDVASCKSILDHFNGGGNELHSILFEFFDQFPNRLGHRCLSGNLKGSEFVAGLQMLTNLFALESKTGEILNASEETPSSNSGNSYFEQSDQSERTATQAGSSGMTNFQNVTANTSTGSRDIWRKEDRGKKEDNLDRRRVDEIISDLDRRPSSSEKIDKSHDDHRRLLSNISEPESLSLTHSEMLNRANFRHEVISSAFVQAIKQSTSSSDVTKGTDAGILSPNREDPKVENEFFTPRYGELNELKLRSLMNAESEAEIPELWMTDDDDDNDEQTTSRNALISPEKDVFFIEDDNTTPDIVLRDIETAERAIKRMKTVFEKFLSEGERGEEQTRKDEIPLGINSKVSSQMKLRFPVNDELKKLQKLVQTVANYVTITAGCSSQSIEAYKKVVGSDMQRNDLMDAGCSSKSSDNLEEVPEIFTKNRSRLNTDDSQAVEVSVPKTEGPVSLRKEIDYFSSWDKVIPLSTRRQIAKMKRKRKPKKAVAAGELPRRMLKVVKLIEDKNLDFLSARSVPQRGRGLSSGYLMDSDSDGNFTISRPPTPDSVESETSQNLSCDNEQPDVFLNPLKASEIFPISDTSHSRNTNRPVESCWSSSSANQIKDTFLQTKSPDLSNKLAEKSIDDIEPLKIQESLEISCSLLSNHAKTSSWKELALPGIIDGNLNTQHTTCDEEVHVLGAESISIESDLEYMTSVDAVEIKNKLKDVVKQILSHQFSGVDPSTNGFRIGSKNASLTSVSEVTRIDSSLDLQSNNSTTEDGVEDPKQIENDCHKEIRKLLSKDDDTSTEQLNVHYKGPDSTSRNSDAVSFEISPRKSRVSVKHVAIGTEYNVEAFKDLLDTFEKIHSIGKKAVEDQASQNCEVDHDDSLVNGKDERSMIKNDFDEKLLSKRTQENSDASGPATISYDSFDSWTSENTIQISEPSGLAMSISDHTYFEDFPDQVDNSFQFSEASLENFDENSNDIPTANTGNSMTNEKSKKDTTPKKKGIPRPVKGSKERK